MSNLKYPIYLLIIKLSKLSQSDPILAKEMTNKAEKLNGLNRAICILKEYKHQDEREERKKMKKLGFVRIKL